MGFDMLRLANVEKIHQDGMHLAMVAICTFQRPKMLGDCIQSLLIQALPDNTHMHIVVIDNDEFGSGRAAFIEATKLSLIRATYLIQPKRGIASARNMAIDLAIAENADSLIYIDDDETADEKFVSALLSPSYRDAPILGGWNIVNYPPDMPEWARPREKYRAEGSGGGVGGGNMRLSNKAFRSLRFNEALALSGGEDGEFLMRARLKGLEIRFTRRAITIEVAHPERYTLAGIQARAHWIAAANMREEMLKHGASEAILKRSLAILFCGPAAFAQALVGVCVYPFNSTRGKRKMVGALKTMAVAFGRWDAIRGKLPQPYAKTVGQ